MSSWYLIIFAWLYPINPLVKITIIINNRYLIITLISPESIIPTTFQILIVVPSIFPLVPVYFCC